MADIHQAEADRPPLHGYRGETPPAGDRWPAALTVALSRESGARGGSIAKRVGRKLGWQVVDQDLLEFLAQDERAVDELPEAAREWADLRLDELLRARALNDDPSVVQLARVILGLAAQGEVVLIGRGAGFILPATSTLHVRIIAPLDERIAYMSQWLRLSEDEAAEQVRDRDARRAEFLDRHLQRQPNDLYAYDLLLNSARLGEDGCAELIAQAVRAKQPADDVAAAGADQER